MPLTNTEQAEALRFLGYTNWTNLASSFQLGFPAPSQPEYLVRDAFSRIDEHGVELVRRDLKHLRCIEEQIGDTSRLKADQIGNLKINKTEMGDLEKRMRYWVDRLSDDLGGYFNPFGHGTISGRNVKVC